MILRAGPNSWESGAYLRRQFEDVVQNFPDDSADRPPYIRREVASLVQLSPSRPKVGRKLDTFCSVLSGHERRGWVRLHRVAAFLSRRGLDISQLTRPEKLRYATFLYRVARTRHAYPRALGILRFLRQRLGLALDREYPSDMVRLLTTAIYAGPNRQRFADTLDMIEARVGSPLSALEDTWKKRAMTAGYAVAQSTEAGFQTFTETLTAIDDWLGVTVEEVRSWPLADQFNIISAAYHVAQRKDAGRLAFTSMLTWLEETFSKAQDASSVALLPASQLQLVTAAYEITKDQGGRARFETQWQATLNKIGCNVEDLPQESLMALLVIATSGSASPTRAKRFQAWLNDFRIPPAVRARALSEGYFKAFSHGRDATFGDA